MKIEHDPTAGALYGRLGEAKIMESEDVHRGAILDFGGSGTLVGIEALSASKWGHQPLKEKAA